MTRPPESPLRALAAAVAAVARAQAEAADTWARLGESLAVFAAAEEAKAAHFGERLAAEASEPGAFFLNEQHTTTTKKRTRKAKTKVSAEDIEDARRRLKKAGAV